MNLDAMARRRRLAGLTVGLAAGALALAGCAGQTPAPGDDGAGAGGEDLGRIVVVSFLPLESFTFTPEMFAYAGGYFEKHGLDVELQAVQGSSAAIQSLLGGAATITRASTVDLFPPLEQGQPLTAVGTMAYKSNLRVISADSNPVESTSDMEGEVMGMGSIGGTSEKMLDLALDAGGVDRDSVTRQAVPVTGATFELVKQGQLAGYIVSLDTSIQIGQQNADAIVTDAGLGDAPDMQAWVTTSANLEDPEKVAQIEAFLAAIKEAVQFVIDDAENDFANVLQILRDSGEFSFAALDNDEVASAALDIYTTETWVDPDGGTELLANDLDAWINAYETYVEAEFLEGGRDPQEWITDEYLPAG
ncbi:ABC transporter substrate-binding protein [Microbacterium album]|nr:ABC transporter substrate-binding protein [Microbacterium album]